MKLLQNVNLEQPNSPDGMLMTGRIESVPDDATRSQQHAW